MGRRAIHILALSTLATACGSSSASGPGESPGPSCDPLMYIAGDACVPLSIGAPAEAAPPGDDARAIEGGPDAPTEAGPGQGPLPDPSTASSYLMNPAHTGAIADPTLLLPLAPAWSRLFARHVSNALIAHGLVYVSADMLQGGSTLFALTSATGSTAWSADLGAEAMIAYDAGRVFALDGTTLRAYDAVSGALEWTAMPGSRPSPEHPVAYRGIVYARGSAATSALYAFDEASGAMLWTADTVVPSAAPAVSEDGLFVSDGCGEVQAFDRIGGALLWQHPGTCSGGQGGAPVLYGNAAYVTASGGNLILDARTGAVTGTFTADLPPAFEGSSRFCLAGAQLFATDTSSGRTWTFPGDGSLATAPLVVDGTVFVGSASYTLFGVRAYDTSTPWSVNTGMLPLTGPSAAEGILAVPADSMLWVYASARLVDAGAADAGDAPAD